MDHGGGQAGTQVFTKRPGNDIYHADQEYGGITEDLKLQCRAAEHKEQGNSRAGPAVRLQHQVLAERAEIAEHRAQHHTDQQGGKTEGEGTHRDLQLADGNRQDDAADNEGVPVPVGMEKALQPGQHQAYQSAEGERQEYLHERFQDQGSDIGISVFQGLRDAEGNGKDDQAYRVIQGNHRQQHIRHRSFGFVLADYHQGGGRGGGRSDCAQGYSYGHRQQVRHDKVQGNQRRVHAQGGKAGLDDADHRSLFARLLQG